MNKDVIYIDVEDDITAIIGKMKASNEKIVALVPPKRVGVLQSAVNLRLLQRMAKNANKHMVLITNNQALIGLSAVAGIPVAKNLQSKPELAEIPVLSVDDGEDIIDGAQLPIGELEKTADVTDEDSDSVNKAMRSINIDDKQVSVAALGAMATKKMAKVKSGVKIPDFNSFRKKLFIGIGAGILLLVFLVWAIWFAPAAKIIITARTTPASVNTTATLAGNAATDVSKGMIQSTFQQTKKDVSVDFTPTGQKDVGAKATGAITVKNCDSNTSFVINANTVFVASTGQRFLNPGQATVPGFTGSASVCRGTGAGAGTVTIPVGAEQSGEGSNVPSTGYSISGINGDIYANGSQMSGGTTKVVTVVTADDIQKATASMVAQPSDPVKAQLVKLVPSSQVVIDDSFTIAPADPVSVPAVGAEASKATLTSSTTYTLSAIAKSDLEVYLKANVEKQLVGKDNQRIYDDGISKVKLSGYTKTGDTSTVNIVSTGQIGPKIDEAAIKEQVKGKIYGEVQSTLQQIDGISNVDVKFSTFWVHTVPNDVKKITVEFKLQNG